MMGIVEVVGSKGVKIEQQLAVSSELSYLVGQASCCRCFEIELQVFGFSVRWHDRYHLGRCILV